MQLSTLRPSFLTTLVVVAFALSGCGMLFGGSEEAPTPTAPPRTLVPTFTPTAVAEQAPTPAPAAVQPAQVITVAVADPAAITETSAITGAAAVAGAGGVAGTVGTATDEPAPAAVTPTLKIEADIVNVRLGPGTTFGLVGTANQGQRFDIKGRNADKSWYLICCVNGQEGWVNTEFTDEDDEELAPVVAGPAQPVAQVPAAAPAPAPAEPTATPAPAAAPAPADACAGIGGDGCKFKLRAGPSFAANSGGELKLQLHFIHSGVAGGQPQGSYFVWVEKDGQKLPVSDGVRSIALQDQSGMLGKYNYEFKIARDQIPGGNVAGNYAIWVLDGNGERDSQTFTFSVPDGQGEVWMQFDQG